MRGIELGPAVNVVVNGDMWGRLPGAAKIRFTRTVSCWVLHGVTGKQIRIRVYDYRTHPHPGRHSLSRLAVTMSDD